MLIRRLLFALALSICAAASATAVAVQQIQVELGEPLQKTLVRYNEAGLNILSSSVIVPAKLATTLLPDPRLSLVQQVQQLLAPHQLDLEMTSLTEGFVVRSASQAPTDASPNVVSPMKAAEATAFIEELVVRGNYQVTRIGEQARSLDQQDLRSMPSIGRDVLKSLSVLPGIANSGVSAKGRFRGGDNNEVLYTIDNVEIIEPFHLRSFQSWFTAVNPNIIASADVYTSGFPVSLGTRMSGVVDLELLTPTKPIQGNLEVNFVTAAADVQGYQGAFSYLGSVRRSMIDHVLSSLDVDYGRPKFNDGLIKLSYDTLDHQFTFGALSTSDNISLRNSDEDETGRSRYNYRSLWLRWDNQSLDHINTSIYGTLINASQLRVGSLTDDDDAVGELAENNDFKIITLGARLHWLPNTTYSVEAGVEAQRHKGSFDVILNSTYGPLSQPLQVDNPLQVNISNEQDGTTIAGYISVSAKLVERLRVTGGVRYDSQDLDPIHTNELSARLRVDYDLSEEWRLFMDIGRYTQQQQLHELQIDNETLELEQPAHSDQLSLGVVWRPSDATTLRLDGYHRKISNPWSRFDNLYNRWVLLPELHADRVELTPSRASLQGGEFAVTSKLSQHVAWNFSYVYADAKERVASHWILRPWQQRHTVKTGFQYNTERWRIGIAGTLRSGWPTTNLVTSAEQLPTTINDASLPNFYTLDLHVARRMQSRIGEWEAYLDVSNLSNRKNVGGYKYETGSAPDRKAQKLLPIVLSLGFSWRF